MKSLFEIMQGIIDKRQTKLLKRKIGDDAYGFYSYKGQCVRDVAYGLLNPYSAFNVAYRKVYDGRYDDIIQGLSFNYDVERDALIVTLFSSRCGFIIGKSGEYIERLEREMSELVGKQTFVELHETKFWFRYKYEYEY